MRAHRSWPCSIECAPSASRLPAPSVAMSWPTGWGFQNGDGTCVRRVVPCRTPQIALLSSRAWPAAPHGAPWSCTLRRPFVYSRRVTRSFEVASSTRSAWAACRCSSIQLKRLCGPTFGRRRAEFCLTGAFESQTLATPQAPSAISWRCPRSVFARSRRPSPPQLAECFTAARLAQRTSPTPSTSSSRAYLAVAFL